MAILIICIVLAVIIIGLIFVYNNLIANKNRMLEAWSGIDVFLKKRYDLIPNLVETVKGYAAHEKNTLEEIVRYRTQAMQAKDTQTQVRSEASLEKALVNLFAVAENYPNLKANSNFQQLQLQLAELETELERSRRYYNGTIREYNILLESFPSNIVAGMFNFPKGEFFTTESSQKETPKVSF